MPVEQFRITQRPQQRTSANPVDNAVVARPRDYGAGAFSPPGGDLEGLVKGLSSFNPALAEMARKQQADEMRDARDAGAAAAQTHEAPRDALTGQEVPLPETIKPAYGDHFRTALGEGLAQRSAVETKLALGREYNDRKLDPDFDVQSWLGQKRSEALAGITDPHAQAIIGQHFTQLEADIGTEAERVRVDRMEKIKVQNATLWAADMFTPDMDAQRLYSAFTVYQDRVKTHNISKNDAAQYLMLQLVSQSNKLGGAPELFDVFDVKDGEGYSLSQRVPALAAQATQAKRQAIELRDKALDKDAEQGNAKALMAYESDIDTNPAAVTQERLLADFTPHGAFRTPSAVASMWNRAQEAQRKALATQQLGDFFDRGELWRLEPSQQNKVMDARIGGLVGQLAEANRQGDMNAVAALGAQVLQAHTRAGASVAFDQLKGFATHLVTTAPNKEGPTPGFNAAAALYKAMSGMPQYRDLYFTEDISKVLQGYTAATTAGADAKAAYVQAYQAVSPEAKAAAEAYVKTPEFQKMASSEVGKWVTGSSMNWLKVFGQAGRPMNQEIVGAALTQEMRSWRARNPFATSDQAEAYAESWTGSNFVIDKTTQAAIKVPQGYPAKAVQEALSNHSARAVKEFKLADRNDTDWSVQYIPVGSEGQYQPVMFDGIQPRMSLDPISIDRLLAAQHARTSFSDEERKVLGAMRAGVAKGELPPISNELLAKAEALKVMRPDEVKAYRDASNTAFLERLNGTPKVTLGTPSFDNLQFIPNRGDRIDNQLTANVARDFMAHQRFSASLVTMGEAVALRAYDDPARGAGRNIGMGYNLKANASNARSDLKRAMVPEERIDDVLEGRADLTPDQAKRLLLIALPRYEKQVQDTAESTNPGLWGRMTPAQKAVMVDIAWQTGGVDKFKKAWAALASGDMQTFADESKVFYTDRNGERKEDTRRNNLRAAMLAGVPYWESALTRYGSLPGTKLASLN